MTRSFSALSALLFVVACAGNDGPDDIDSSDRDPRCVSACTAPEPRFSTAGQICDAPSRVRCLDECETRIATLSTVCQNCLVEDACFGPRGCSEISTGGFCMSNNGTTTCTLMSDYGSCTYTVGDVAAEQRCNEQVDPRREVSCESEFRPTTECASVCT